jgi:hypothetical protein
MGGGSASKDHPWEYLTVLAMGAIVNYPLWRASAIGQSGFTVSTINFIRGDLLANVPPLISPHIYAFAPPYKGMVTTVFGMTWARAAISGGSDRGWTYLTIHELCSDCQ